MVNKPVTISICIPAYKRIDFLKKLLDSISIQTFTDFEVIVTDDSSGNSVNELCSQYKDKFLLYYFKNEKPLGTPENWNEAIRHSHARWIKMMHDDDWFSAATSLQKFANAAQKYPAGSFIFSGFYNVNLSGNQKRKFIIGRLAFGLLKRSPLFLFKGNLIGHPSTTLIKKNNQLIYDKNLKWVVDFEFYIRYLNHNKGLIVIREPLINIGLNEFQVTKESFGNPNIEIPEMIYLYHKLPEGSFKNIFVYDYYWRSIRNSSIRSLEDAKIYAGNDVIIPVIIKKMIKVQGKWSLKLLKNGLISKTLMFFSYLLNYTKI